MVVRGSYDERVFGRSGRLPEAAEPPGGGLVGEVGEPVRQPVGATERRRIRDEALDGVYVMAFSLLASTATACALVLLTKLAG